MTTLPILFPGQGAQAQGMGKAFTEAYPEAAAVWAEADETLGFSLSGACWDSEDEVNRTDVAQPGIFTAGVAAIRVLEARGLDLAAAPTADHDPPGHVDGRDAAAVVGAVEL